MLIKSVLLWQDGDDDIYGGGDDKAGDLKDVYLAK